MHSSRMRTGRALTVSRGGGGGVWVGVVPAWSRGVSARGVYLPGPRGVCLLPEGGVCSGGCTCLVPGGGVPDWSLGGVCSRGCTCLVRGVVCSGGVYLPGPGGLYLPGPGGGVGGVCSWGRGVCTCLVPWRGVPTWSGGGVPVWSRGVPGQVLPPCEQNDRQV